MQNLVFRGHLVPFENSVEKSEVGGKRFELHRRYFTIWVSNGPVNDITFVLKSDIKTNQLNEFL